jgi:hypothetical protein
VRGRYLKVLSWCSSGEPEEKNKILLSGWLGLNWVPSECELQLSQSTCGSTFPKLWLMNPLETCKCFGSLKGKDVYASFEELHI